MELTLPVPYVLVLAAASGLAYIVAVVVYRIVLHPIARFPGPRLAAITYWYEGYFDVILGGQYTNKIWKLHARYGPIVRINPDELHIDDPSFIDEIYAGGSKKRDKTEYFTCQFGQPQSSFGAVSHDRHRMLRGSMNRYFSKAAVSKLEPMIKKNIDKLSEKFEAHAGNGAPIDLGSAYSCMTTDVVCEYCFGRSTKFLDQASFEPNLRAAILGGSTAGLAIKQWPPLYTVMDSLPSSLVGSLMPGMNAFLKFRKDMAEQTEVIAAGAGSGYEKRTETYPTIFHELLNSDLPGEEKQAWRLEQEGAVIVGAGTETTAWTLAALTFYLLGDAAILQKLKDELRTVASGTHDLPSASRLEQLPYLNATVHEGLRLTYGLATRSARAAREPIVYRGIGGDGSKVEWTIPPNTPVGMTSVFIHQNGDIYPDPLCFRPERWLDENGRRRTDLDRYLFSFSKGSRQCLGMK